MTKVHIPIRAPTGRAWVTFAISFIVAGELLYEVRKEEPATFFKIPFTDAELIPWIVFLGLMAAVSLIWLITLYAKPGHLLLDLQEGLIRRQRRRIVQVQVVEAPASEWLVRVVYFSDSHRERGVFKRIELRGPDHEEVLLFTDIKEGEKLARGIEAMGEQLSRLTIDIEQAQQAQNDGE